MPFQRFIDPNTSVLFESGLENVGSGARAAYDAEVARINMGFYNSGFSSALGGIFRSIGGAAVGAAAAAGIGELTKVAARVGHPSASAAGPTAALPPMVAAGTGAVPTTALGRAEQAALHPILATEQLLGLGHAAAHMRYYPPGTKGTHMIKRGPHAGLWVRNRHRNLGNFRALRRALSRAHGVERIFRKVMHFTHPGKARGRVAFRRRRRSR